MREDRLTRKIRQVLDVFPWYARMLAAEGADIRTAQSLQLLPLMTSEMLERYYYQSGPPFEPRDNMTCYRTSGTSSRRRKTIYYSAEDERRYIRIKSGLFNRIIAPFGITTALSDMGTGHAASTAPETFDRIGIKVDTIAFQQPIEEHLERLRTLRPQLLYTMPSILDRILAASAEDPSSYGIRQVVLVGEIASPAWLRSVAERLWLAPESITDTYGSIEIGTIAYYSHEHGRYLFAEGIEAEGIPAQALYDDIEPLPENESVLVLTSWARDLFPAIRYVTYDIVRDLRPIVVKGQSRMSFQAIVRRIGTELKHGEKISVYDIEDVVYRHLKEATVRVHVQSNALTVHIDSKDKTPEIYERIELELQDRIPEIGIMIRGGLLHAIRVVPSEISYDARVLKHKRIFYD
ncbi:CoF synthetase [Cohnella herbarum]|uniref:CoF synthetase n=1 Tax=Cohnella herbarum TaxID=2728023 RepID=UPI0020C3FB91|nr:CoF synthetase [Cohnella herbarum]